MKTKAAIGLGCVTFGREIDKAASFKMMDHALGKGIKMFDTAAAYGNGASEEIIGHWLKTRQRSGLVIATKILPPFDLLNIATSVENSLKRLGVDAIDILYLHRWDESCETPECLSALDNLLRAGKVKALGASNFSAKQLENLLQLQEQYSYSTFQFVQNNHNLAVSDIDDAFRRVCVENNIEIVTYSPLGAGFLTGKYGQDVQSGSRFDLVPGHQNIYFQDAAFKRLERLRSVAARTGYTPVHLALAWALHQDVSTVLVGGRTTQHLDQAFKALSFFDAALFAELEG
ncbi:aldo/keto reductase [Flavisolibacter ginsenosidimutans]|uniref:Aldo/keto reductase n=1 Tax=Flavisolibacter ginsenosidimutans TaxID=661481 RepID=A0A5B8UDC2_9BACT|nr:aldo/keto reductase [Flavisolibacter ginsenosidimutans]QEC54402.1 aldo/keto reductase [Flavisolibacter ginsenosidimutans]